MDADKRAFPRFVFSEPVAYAQSEDSASGSVAGNISLGGIAIRVQEFVPVGAVLELQIHLEPFSAKLITTKARVVRVREALGEGCFEIGLQFIKDEECIRAIGEYIHMSRVHQQ